MARITATERQRLGRVRPETFEKLLELMDAAEARGFTVAVPDFGGIRSTARQTRLYNDSLQQGGGQLAYPVGKPGTSRHEYGAAFDLHIVGGGHGAGGRGNDADYRQLAEDGRAIGLTAGYFWQGKSKDPYHFQLNESLEDSKARWQAMKSAGIVRAVALVLVAALAVAVARQ
jgi:hypothetical protein